VARLQHPPRWCAANASAQLQSASLLEYNRGKLLKLSRNVSTMTRTPTTIVTATRIAARAFAWGNSIGAHGSGIKSMPLPSPLTLY